jgi:hypothetical protein
MGGEKFRLTLFDAAAPRSSLGESARSSDR